MTRGRIGYKMTFRFECCRLSRRIHLPVSILPHRASYHRKITVLTLAPARARAVVVGQTHAREPAVGPAPILAAMSLALASTRVRTSWSVLVSSRGVVLVLNGAASFISCVFCCMGVLFAPIEPSFCLECPSPALAALRAHAGN